MPRFGFTLQLRPGAEAEYDARHQSVWPEVREVIAASGIRDYMGFRDGLVAFYVGEADDPQAAIDAMGSHPVTIRWAAYLSDLVEQRPRGDDGRMRLAIEMFHEAGTPAAERSR